MNAVRYVLAGLAMLLGSALLYAGMGFDVPAVEFKGVDSYGVALGIAFLVVGILLVKIGQERPSPGASA